MAYHFSHVFGDRLGCLHRVNGDRAGLLNAELEFETFLELVSSEIQLWVLVVIPLNTHTHTHRKKISQEKHD